MSHFERHSIISLSLSCVCLLSACTADERGSGAVDPGDVDPSADVPGDAAPAIDVDVDDGDGHGGAGPEPWSLDIVWASCSLRTGADDGQAECADIDVPLHWSDPAGDRISLFLKRRRGSEGGGQVWVLPGGPGQSGSDLEPLVEQLVTLDSDRSYYLLDHRGVGRSTKLRCETSEGETGPNGIGLGQGESAACLEEVREEWSDAQLAGFSTLNAAHDVGQLIDHLRVNDEVVSVWGGSYGTVWLERYLGLYPDQPDSVVMSAIAVDVDLLSVDRYVDDVTRRWLSACDDDPECGARFVETFDQSALEVVTGLFSGEGKELCPEMVELELTVEILKPFFGQIFADIQGRSLYLPIVYRLARCAPEDVAAMKQLVTALTPPGGVPEVPLTVRQWGVVLGENIAVSELTSERSFEEVRADYDAAIAVQGVTPRLVESKAIWPHYPAPELERSPYQGQMLLLHGEYDFLPPEAYQPTVDHYLATNPNASFVLLPGAPHSLESPTSAGTQCGGQLLVGRLLDPNAPVIDCGEEVLPLLFAPSVAVSASLFGTADPWDG